MTQKVERKQNEEGENILIITDESREIQVHVDGFDEDGEIDEEGKRYVKYRVSGVTVTKIAERVQYYDADGKLVTESFKDYTRNTIKKQFASLNEFIKTWQSTERKQAIIEELAAEGVIWQALEEDVSRDLDPFDLICHVAFDQPPLTRRERAENVKKRNYLVGIGAR